MRLFKCTTYTEYEKGDSEIDVTYHAAQSPAKSVTLPRNLGNKVKVQNPSEDLLRDLATSIQNLDDVGLIDFPGNNSDQANNFIELGKYLDFVGKFQATIACYERAMELAPEESENINDLICNTYYSTGQLDLAQEFFQKPHFTEKFVIIGKTRDLPESADLLDGLE